MSDVDPRQYDLEPEAEARMKELRAEVQERLEEMSSIFCRAVGIKDDEKIHAIAKFDPKIVKRGQRDYIEIYCDATSCGCVVYYSDGHVLVEWPCGSGG